MVKKEKVESCSGESCHCGGCCGGKILITLLALLGVIAAVAACLYSCKTLKIVRESYDLSVLTAGGEENFNRMNKVYESEAYVEYAKENVEQAEAYFGLDSENTSLDSNDDINEDYEDANNEEDTNTYEENSDNSASSDDVKAIVEDMLASSPIRGDKNARFTIIEYTELRCPYCQMHAQNGTINSVIEQFPGEVNSVSRHFIIHGEDALKLAATMECIAELKPEIYHETFEKAFEAYPIELANLISLATELGADTTALQTCVDEGRYIDAVNDMMNQAYEVFGVNGTPGNVIIDRETGKFELVSGAYPVESFVEVINNMKKA